MNDEHSMRDLLPGYTLGILDEEEKNDVREHLSACASCRAELVSYREVTGRLAAAVPDTELPAGLEERIMRAIAALRSRRRTTTRGVPRRRAPWPAFTALAAILAVALGVGNLLQWTSVLQPRARGARARLTTALLSGTGEARDAYGTIVLEPSDNEGVLAVTGLRRLDPGHQYQLWLIKDGERRSGGVFSPDAEGYGSMLLTVPRDFKDFHSFGVSIEPRGGSIAPTSALLLSGAL
ncbi:MAG: anti-sigma factor [Spirochaetia bacterium]